MDLDVIDPDVVDSEVPGELVLEGAAVLEVVEPEGVGGRGKVLDGHGGKTGVEGLGDPGGKGGKVVEGLEIDGPGIEDPVGIEGSGTEGPPEVDGSGLGDPGGTMGVENPGGQGGKVVEVLEIDGSGIEDPVGTEGSGTEDPVGIEGSGIEGSGTEGPPETDGSGLGVPVGNGDPGVVKELVPDESVLLEVLVEPALVSDDWVDGKLVCDTDADEELTGGELETEGLG